MAKAGAEARLFHLLSAAPPERPLGRLWLCAVAGLSPSSDLAWSLSAEELAAAKKPYAPEQQRAVLLGHWLRRLILADALTLAPAQLSFDRAPGRKPVLRGAPPAFDFSIAHSAGFFALGLCPSTTLGVDLTTVPPRFTAAEAAVADAYFSPLEQTYLAQHPDAARAVPFARLWARKEAVLKALGCGLAGLDQGCDVLASSFHCRRSGTRLYLTDLVVGDGLILALALTTPFIVSEPSAVVLAASPTLQR